MPRLVLLVALALVGCAPGEDAWEEGELGEWQPGLDVGQAGGCSTFIVDGLSRQLIAEQNCIRPNALVSFKGATNVSLGSNVYPYLEQKPRDGLVAAAKAFGTISINSAFRTLAQQYLLYRWYQNGQCGIGLAAQPGNSNHETGIAIDVGNYSAALTALRGKGFSHSYPSSDPVHYDYTAGGTVDLRAESVLAFQKLWNLNHPGDKIAEDGDYGPQTAARLARSPTDGFPKGSTCATQGTPTPSSPPQPSSPPTTPPDPSSPPATTTPEWAAELAGEGGPRRLRAGTTATVWVELKNTGSKTWTPSTTFLGTAAPHDRLSDLAGPGWPSGNRAAAVDHDTRPGELGRFSFTIVAPDRPAAYSESFGVVVEGVAWLDNFQYTLDLEVSGRALIAGEPQAAATGGDVSSGCAVGGAPDASPLCVLFVMLWIAGRRRARDIP